MMANLARESGAIPKCLKIKLVKNTISDEFRCGGYGKVCTAKLKSNSELVAVKKVASIGTMSRSRALQRRLFIG